MKSEKLRVKSHPHYCKIYPQVLCKLSAVDFLPKINTVIFDVDGVLIDVKNSFRKAIIKTVDFYFSNILKWKNAKNVISISDVEKFKMAGGFNDDWDLSFSAILFFLYKGIKNNCYDILELKKLPPSLDSFFKKIYPEESGPTSFERNIFKNVSPYKGSKILSLWDKKIIKRIFQEFYAGEKEIKKIYCETPIFVKTDGLYLKEKVIIDTKLLNKKFTYGIITGRTEGELYLALKKMKAEKIFKKELIITQDDGIRKPDAACLEKIVKNREGIFGVYVGDTIDDLNLVENYKKTKGDNVFLSCIVDLKHRKFYKEKNADIIVDNVNTLLKFINTGK